MNDRGFILTGRDLPQGAWPLPRPPLPFETSLPGVFAVGDVRYGSVKRVAGAVGEGSVAVGSVHEYLSESVEGWRSRDQTDRTAARLQPRLSSTSTSGTEKSLRGCALDHLDRGARFRTNETTRRGRPDPDNQERQAPERAWLVH